MRNHYYEIYGEIREINFDGKVQALRPAPSLAVVGGRDISVMIYFGHNHGEINLYVQNPSFAAV